MMYESRSSEDDNIKQTMSNGSKTGTEKQAYAVGRGQRQDDDK